MSDAVLVTGAFGLVGSATVKQLASAGRRVVATDLETEANRKAAADLPSGVQVRWADLTDPAAVESLLAVVSPAAVIHLAAVIPPLCYAKPGLAYKVNVGATANLVKAAEAQAKPPRLVQASSIAVYGPRNPYTITDVLTAETPVNPYDNYGKHKVEAEALVRASSLDWVILRLGGVLTTEPNLGMDPNLIFFEGVLPTDGRLQTVDVRDVAFAFAAATTADVLGQTLLIGGDDSHRLRQGEIGSATSAAMGLVGALPPGRKGDPNDDGGWFATDWMDSATAQAVLKHQHYSWPDMLTETADKVGWKRYAFRVIAPVAREFLKRQSPYRGQPPGYGNPWEAVRRKWGAPENDGKVS
ncbi:nucleoside-diphosphate-sugar epimerase [Mycolicibacterium sp. BK556]|uniref:NAD-dependent epimerase/dehydratase family protein n=1 Tax=Mycobacteriaceae TaxID=1762 RepID=UPI00105CADD9|nr:MULTISPECIES: NAD(P)-dependent oxidoreductase [Mycobacteriaceae]MBB3605652.1 nucleoside-diphosphate-sugar epimerase [Mycolicibacterium sp. BK556]MBB3635851.1 nucleoside-diphosphate-sugar epimerase [Mycolicibacterium sp. BK607]TDO08973.1 nucleoside-diphosphate-sugar epimerase [Mycobacterium sp. BK086]